METEGKLYSSANKEMQMLIDAILMQINLKINSTISPEGFTDFLKLTDKKGALAGQSAHDIVNQHSRTK